jgi:hypothetical protein
MQVVLLQVLEWKADSDTLGSSQSKATPGNT